MIINLLLNVVLVVVLAIVTFLLAKWLMGEAEIGDPLRKIILLILFLVFFFWLIAVFGGYRFDFVGGGFGARAPGDAALRPGWLRFC